MNRRQLLHWCVAGCVSGTVALAGRLLEAQQPGRARLQEAPPARQAPAATTETAQRIARPEAGNIEVQIPQELEDLLVQWEQKSSKIQRLHGEFERYVYDTVFCVDRRSRGEFWYEAPDRGRMDFLPGIVPDPAVNPKRLGNNGKPFAVQAEEPQKWVCTGKDIYIIHETQKLFDYIEIPPQQQGRNIINGPLPFLFGMKAEHAKARYFLSIGPMNWPNGQFKTDEKGKQVMTRAPQIHIVAAPKYDVDKREWKRAEVLLDGVSFLPRGIRLISPDDSKESVYVFFPENKMWVNQRWLLSDPFNERPPRGFQKATHTRATDEEQAPAGRRAQPPAMERPAR